MPDPSQVSTQNINIELGSSSTTQLSMNQTSTRNLGNKSSGTIKYSDCRWGINFPGRRCTPTGTTIRYSLNNLLEGDANSLGDAFVNFSAYAEVDVRFYANGVMSVWSETKVDGSTVNANEFTRTWLTSGSASDYTVQLSLSTGSVSGSATGSDLAMSTNRNWKISVLSAGAVEFNSATGNLIFKSGGTEFFRRPIDLAVSAELAGL